MELFADRCSLTTEEVKDFYWRGGPEAHESTDIVFLSQSVRPFINIPTLLNILILNIIKLHFTTSCFLKF